MDFCTAVNCMDGRVQEPVMDYMKKEFGALHVDMITEPGPNQLLATDIDDTLHQSIINRIDISVHQHGSRLIAVAGHHDCAGNPAGKGEQDLQTRMSVICLKKKYPDLTIIGLWIDENWKVHRLE
ncbi:MAG: hypothetical protein H8D46_05100 [FCB group bacterium]|nr:hypothetical protein [FCB group bacterium]